MSSLVIFDGWIFDSWISPLPLSECIDRKLYKALHRVSFGPFHIGKLWIGSILHFFLLFNNFGNFGNSQYSATALLKKRRSIFLSLILKEKAVRPMNTSILKRYLIAFDSAPNMLHRHGTAVRYIAIHCDTVGCNAFVCIHCGCRSATRQSSACSDANRSSHCIQLYPTASDCFPK